VADRGIARRVHSGFTQRRTYLSYGIGAALRVSIGWRSHNASISTLLRHCAVGSPPPLGSILRRYSQLRACRHLGVHEQCSTQGVSHSWRRSRAATDSSYTHRHRAEGQTYHALVGATLLSSANRLSRLSLRHASQEGRRCCRLGRLNETSARGPTASGSSTNSPTALPPAHWRKAPRAHRRLAPPTGQWCHELKRRTAPFATPPDTRRTTHLRRAKAPFVTRRTRDTNQMLAHRSTAGQISAKREPSNTSVPTQTDTCSTSAPRRLLGFVRLVSAPPPNLANRSW
jgi:hypothetical protein